jgi:hypothetical protein
MTEILYWRCDTCPAEAKVHSNGWREFKLRVPNTLPDKQGSEVLRHSCPRCTELALVKRYNDMYNSSTEDEEED